MTPTKLDLGSMIWWSLPDRIPVSRRDWNSTFPSFSLPDEPLGDPLRRALFRIEAPKGSKRLPRPLPEKGKWAIVIETPRGDKTDLDYRTEFTVETSRTGLLWHKYPVTREAEGLAAQLDEAYEVELNNVTPGAVADLILWEVRANCLAATARKTGGVYFVPLAFEERLDNVEQLVTELGGTFVRIQMSDIARHRDHLIGFVIDDLKSAVESARSNIEARHKGDALIEAKQALDRVRFYSAGLGLAAERAQELETELNDLMVEAATKKTKEAK